MASGSIEAKQINPHHHAFRAIPSDWTGQFIGQSATNDSFAPGVLTVSTNQAPVTTYTAASLGLT